LDFGFRTRVERVVHNRSLLLERILSVDSVSTSTSKTAANNSGDDNSNENTSTDGRGNGSSRGEKGGASLNVVSASVVDALVLVTSNCLCAVGTVRFSGNARLARLSNSVTDIVVEAILGEQARLGVIAATAGRIASVDSTIVSVVTGYVRMCANSSNAGVYCAGVEIVTVNWNNLASNANDEGLRVALVRCWAS